MYDFKDYFSEELRNTPYRSGGEELEDYLRLMDMLLEDYLEHKGLSREDKLFSRGLVITESEMESYYDMPPGYRDRDICDPVMAGAADAALEYISGRVARTEELSGISGGGGVFLGIEYLVRVFALDGVELLAVLLALLPEMDRRYERIMGFLQDDITKTRPTTGLLYALAARVTPRDGAWELTAHPLRDVLYTYLFLRGGGSEGLEARLQLQPLLVRVLLGRRDPEETEETIYHPYTEEDEAPVFFEESAGELEFILSEDGKAPAVYLEHEDGDAVLHILHHLCAKNGEPLYVLEMDQLAGLDKVQGLNALSDLFLRLALFGGRLAVRYLREDGEQADEQLKKRKLALLRRILREREGTCLILFGEKEEPGELVSLPVPFLAVPAPAVALRTRIWEYFLHREDGIRIAEDVVIPDLADCYEISYGMIRKTCAHARATAAMKREPVIDKKLLLESLRQMNQVDFSGLATYVNPAYTWEDITISEDQKEVLKTACDRYRLRNRIGEGWGLKKKNAYGNGVSLLLYGPPGTGKTMAAQVVANELSLPLYRVDISQISSKYIGETEKNLAVIFKAASKANVILFFDEADSLFSRRTEVSDSHDKYANSETSYLLQKVEEYDGMSILATNHYSNFDSAFVRRITYTVHMESPDEETRYALWKGILPPEAEVDEEVDFRFLARQFELSGSNIKSILYNAAYMAGAEGRVIGPEHIVRGIRYEYLKLGRLVDSSDFGIYAPYLTGR